MLKHACWLFALLSCLCIADAIAAADSLTIRFSDLDDWARTRSLGAASINNGLELVKAERDVDLQRSNPELTFDRQDVDDNTETEVTLGKTFEMPWVSIKRRSAWNERLRAADLSAEEQRALLLSELKTGYTTQQLLDAKLSRLTHIREVLTDASHVATTRHTEGHLSGVENHLIQMTVISLQAEHQRALAERRDAANHWRALLGYPAQQPPTLLTPVDFRPVTLTEIGDYTRRFEERPAYQSRLVYQSALAKHAGAERSRFIPSFNLYGGLKTIDPDHDGYVIGVALSLPLLNSNRAAARKFDIERQLAVTESNRYFTEQVGRITSLLASIRETQETLSLSKDHFQEDREALDDLLFSYEEGWLTLSELLNAVQIEVAGLGDYYDQMARYYRDIFELEAITGATLVTFE